LVNSAPSISGQEKSSGTNGEVLQTIVLDHSILPYHLKYRPKTFDEVIGQDAAVASLQSLFKRGSVPHAYIFSGPSGVGKTTLARILASLLKCDPGAVVEADAATYSGIDSIRNITSSLPYSAFGDNPNKMVILDECHALSKAAWQALLKTIEEPPAHVYFCLCTTEASKIPATISNRCHTFTLKPVSPSELGVYLEVIAEIEGLTVPAAIQTEIVKFADGSVRKALVGLSTVSDTKDLAEAKELLNRTIDEDDIINLCRILVRKEKTGWNKAIEVVNGLSKQNMEAASIVIMEYITTTLLRSTNENESARLLSLLDIFAATPITNRPTLVLALGRAFFAAD